jgi:hypothetical protein
MDLLRPLVELSLARRYRRGHGSVYPALARHTVRQQCEARSCEHALRRAVASPLTFRLVLVFCARFIRFSIRVGRSVLRCTLAAAVHLPVPARSPEDPAQHASQCLQEQQGWDRCGDDDQRDRAVQDAAAGDDAGMSLVEGVDGQRFGVGCKYQDGEEGPGYRGQNNGSD